MTFTGQDFRDSIERAAGTEGVMIVDRTLDAAGMSWEAAAFQGRRMATDTAAQVDLEQVTPEVMMLGAYAAGFAYAMGVAAQARRRGRRWRG